MSNTELLQIGTGDMNAHMERMLRIVENDVLLFDNHAVFAGIGDARNDHLQRRIAELKDGATLCAADAIGDLSQLKREIDQPVGLARYVDELVIDCIDRTIITDSELKKLFDRPDELDARIGGVTFLRTLAREAGRRKHDVPHSIMPEFKGHGMPSTFQFYSPGKSRAIGQLVVEGTKQGMIVALTSSNATGEPESVSNAMVAGYAEGIYAEYPKPELIVSFTDDQDRKLRPAGSFPILSLASEGLIVDRFGCFDQQILEASMWPHKIVPARDPKYNKHIDKQYQWTDLPADLQSYRGPDFTDGLIETLGWSDETTTRSTEE